MEVNLKRNIVISSNATCQRAFSKMALIKTELWNRLTDSHLSDIILTSKIAPDRLTDVDLAGIIKAFKLTKPKVYFK